MNYTLCAELCPLFHLFQIEKIGMFSAPQSFSSFHWKSCLNFSYYMSEKLCFKKHFIHLKRENSSLGRGKQEVFPPQVDSSNFSSFFH